MPFDFRRLMPSFVACFVAFAAVVGALQGRGVAASSVPEFAGGMLAEY